MSRLRAGAPDAPDGLDVPVWPLPMVGRFLVAREGWGERPPAALEESVRDRCAQMGIHPAPWPPWPDTAALSPRQLAVLVARLRSDREEEAGLAARPESGGGYRAAGVESSPSQRGYADRVRMAGGVA